MAELRDRLKCDLSFGTAGLRAPMGPGFNRMNRVTVQLTSQGVAQYLSQRGAKIVVVGHDHRHHSDEFAAVVAACLRKKGMLVLGFGDKVIPTPLVSFAVRRQKADFGIMITASHNPAADNGYKVYDCNACQVQSTWSLFKLLRIFTSSDHVSSRQGNSSIDQVAGLSIMANCPKSD